MLWFVIEKKISFYSKADIQECPSQFAQNFFRIKILSVKRGRHGSSAPLGPRWSDNAQQGSNVHKPAPFKFPQPADLNKYNSN